MTTAQAAVELGISRSRVLHLIKALRLKAERRVDPFGGAYWWVEPEALEVVRERKPGRPSKK